MLTPVTKPVSRRAAIAGLAGTVGLVATACGPKSSSDARPGAASSPSGLADVVITHIHAIAPTPQERGVLLATHEGLFEVVGRRPRRIGPVIDLMGFTIAPSGTYLASGHPGPGSPLPDPVGLIASTDRGRTWKAQSRSGVSDFHALASTTSATLAYDNALRVTKDGRTWFTATMPAPPRALAASAAGTVLATTERGLFLTYNDGQRWSPVRTPRLLVVATWVGSSTIVGADVDGRLVISGDAGRSWQTGAQVGAVDAICARRTGRSVTVDYVVGTAVRRTTDLGRGTSEVFAG
ncbi:F510_1955 family glycosylhydrolase [Luteipulveratus halotolerans]|uniref:Photosynthesis system II assembly factor Ycf48/Hcf136-like domain-containing protein n=1 Tax=Luteipulveratus halotolerans TaxID=1631356 RepID=A0A0L6CJ13_9MICO|nr:hypothetical protein [Luteipulveratus halotolerans]KNX37791.1 hypothetical protein VV01_12540 [Luteipulveratus halotolerans]